MYFAGSFVFLRSDMKRTQIFEVVRTPSSFTKKNIYNWIPIHIVTHAIFYIGIVFASCTTYVKRKENVCERRHFIALKLFCRDFVKLRCWGSTSTGMFGSNNVVSSTLCNPTEIWDNYTYNFVHNVYCKIRLFQFQYILN